MSDNLFERLFELFQSSGPINWRLGSEVAKSISGGAEPIEPRLAEEYRELALAAELHLATGLDGRLDIDPDIVPIDRAGWVDANLEAYEYVAAPLGEALGAQPSVGGASDLGGMLEQLGPAMIGMQVGSVAGMLGRHVLGQFDTALPPLLPSRGYLVVPNLEAFAAASGMDERNVRMWAVMHELLHGGLMRLEWVRPHVAGLVSGYFEALDFDPSRITEAFEDMGDPAQLQEMFSGPTGLAALMGSEELPPQGDDIDAFIAFSAGYRNHVINSAAGAILPTTGSVLDRYLGHRAAGEDRQMLRQLMGLHLDAEAVRNAERFCGEVSRRWGDEAFARLWDGPSSLPRFDELADVVGWAARVLLDELPEL